MSKLRKPVLECVDCDGPCKGTCDRDGPMRRPIDKITDAFVNRFAEAYERGEKMQPKMGAIAKCSLGTVGLITSRGPVPLTFPDGNKGVAWKGVHLTACEDGLDKKVQMEPGDMWSSRAPQVLFESFEAMLKDLKVSSRFMEGVIEHNTP